MTIKIGNYALKYVSGARIVPRWKPIVFCVLLSLLFPLTTFADREENTDEEITITVEIKNVGTLEVPAIYHNKEVYLSVAPVLDFIKVKNRPTPTFDSISGYFLTEKDLFLIDETHSQIIYKDKTTRLNPGDIISSETSMYMNLKYFKLFGFDVLFNFRRLWVNMSTNDELPVMLELRQEAMRKNLGRLNGDQASDTTIKRTYPLFHVGMADWAVQATQQSQASDDLKLNLGLGGVVAGGETNVLLSYYKDQPFNEQQQYYQWHYVNNDLGAVKQVTAGKIFAQGIASLYAPVVGAQFTNAPTTYRRSFGTYTISNSTEPNWIVELYVNDVLISYKKADASGFYTFEVPIVYGITVVKLRFYGPNGEQRSSQQYISIPFNFLPVHTFEYAASAGIVEDGLNSKFSRVAMNYGLSGRISVGGGMEYLSSITSGNFIPFLTTSIRLATRLLVSGEYAYNVRSKGVLSYRLPNSIQFDVDYTKYAPGQTAIFYNYLEEKRVALSIPVHVPGASLFTRLTLDQITVPLSKYTNAELALTGTIRAVGLNLTTYASFGHDYNPYFYSLFSASFLLPKKINFTGQMEYDYKLSKVAFAKLTLEKYIFGGGYLNLSFQEFFTSGTEGYTGNYNNILVGLRYDFKFARVSVSALAGSNNTYSRVEAASGSLIYDKKTNFLNVNNRNNVGKAGISVIPYLDVNCNGKRDPGEPIATGLKVRINGGRIVYGKSDTIIRIFDLEPYADYYLQLSTNSFDNIAWQLKQHVIKVTVDANNFKLVEIPVAVVGEVSGTVTLKNKEGKKVKGQGQISVCIFDSSNNIVARTTSESDGYFDYIGLAPGSYTAGMDPEQMKKLHMTTTKIPFTIHALKTYDGDVVNGLAFFVQQ